MERAAELSPDRAEKARRLVAAASAAISTGQADWVEDLAARALAVTADPELRMTARRDAGWALAYSGRRSAALVALLSVAEEASRDLPGVAWDALADAATVGYFSGAPASRRAVIRVLDLLEDGDRRRSPTVARALMSARGGSGYRPAPTRSEAEASSSRTCATSLALPSKSPLCGEPGPPHGSWTNPTWRSICCRTRCSGSRPPACGAPAARGLTALGWAYIDTGRWDEALEAAAEAADLAETNQMDVVAASADVITATVLAMRGDSAAARRHAASAIGSADPAEKGLVAAWARRALGVAAFADGNYLQAFTQLRGLFSEDGTPLHNHVSYLGVADLAAAAVHADRRMEGRDVIERALSQLGGTDSPRMKQLIARARGILADTAGAEAYFGKPLADHAGDQWPFERAQLRLDYAEWLRRRRRINDAKPVLTEALETFRRMQARSWVQRAETELRACGVAVAAPHGARDALSELTPQQRQIVRLASEGLTNRQIGDRLFLSPRTVSTHLYRSYPKLGVTGRNQLRDVIARDGVPPAGHEKS